MMMMEEYGGDGGGGVVGDVGEGGTTVAAPFVLKTYRMVNDPATDQVIAWGRDNNSFVVVDPFAFSQTLLPTHFKHSNFSSFVRQLNTYGFRKVDPDRWEFAHQSFLRGQAHLLRHIVRRSSVKGNNSSCGGGQRREGEDGDDAAVEERVAMELIRLRDEQRATEEEVQRMWRRVKEAERRPKQMLAFLCRVLGDPQLLHRLLGRTAAGGSDGASSGDSAHSGEKRARLMIEAESKKCTDDGSSSGSSEKAGLPFFGADNQFFPVNGGGDQLYEFGIGGAGGLDSSYPFSFASMEQRGFE